MLFDANVSKPDVYICRYVARAVGRDVSDVEALVIRKQAAASTGSHLRDLDTTVGEHVTRPN